MDNLTHTLTGLMLSRAGFNRRLPRATAILLISSNIPDIDAVYFRGGALDYLDHHRGITHALISVPILAALTAVIVRLAGRKPLSWMRAIIAGCAGVLSHLLLDYTNTYGVRLLLPFSSEWLRLDITNVVDLWIWGLLILCVAGPLLSRLVSSEIGAKPGTGRGAAIFALLAMSVYEGGRYLVHQRAINLLESYNYSGAAPRRVGAFPDLVNPFSWSTAVETSNAVLVQRINLLAPYDPTGGETFYYPHSTQAMEAARRTDVFQRYLRFAQFPFWQVSPVATPEGGVRVEAMDLRFGAPSAPRFVATAVLDSSLRVVQSGFGFGPLQPR
ncbi:MAG: metal-dependent hydrolase [Bryobacterales bacterium]|nr:metal-dependent hydrolase [Bryobacterales bacterium]